MSTLPIKLLHDEDNRPFIPFTAMDVVYENYPSVDALPIPAREGNVATVTIDGNYYLYIYYDEHWYPLTQRGVPGNSGVYTGDDPPSEEEIVVWIDTSDGEITQNAEGMSF